MTRSTLDGVEVVESPDYEGAFSTSWLMIAKTLQGYVVYQEHPAFVHSDRTPRPLAVFETKRALLEWLAKRWTPQTPEYELRGL